MIQRRLAGVAIALMLTVAGCARGGNNQGVGDGLGETRAGIAGQVGTTSPGPAKDLGQQVSDLVAAIDGIEAVGAGMPIGGGAGVGGPVGVSTLIQGDEAFVGIDATTLAFSGKTGDLSGGSHGGIPAVGVPITTEPVAWGAQGTTIGTGGGGPAGAPSTTGETPEFRDMLRSHITVAFPQIREVYVTTDPVLVARIARTAGREEARADDARAIADQLRARSGR